MKEKIFKLLEAKFPSVRKDGLTHVAASLALVATEESVDELVGKMTAEAVESTIKEWRQSVDAENAKAIETYKKSHPDPVPLAPVADPTPTPDPTPAPDTKPAENNTLTAEAIAKIVSDGIAKATQPLVDRINGMEQEKVINERKSLVENELKGMPESYRSAILDGFSGKTFENEDAFNEYLNKTKESVTSFRTEMAEQGLKDFGGGAPKPKDGSEVVSADVSAFIKGKENDPLGGKKL